MRCFQCMTKGFAGIARAAAKSASARLRSMGSLAVAPNWAQRAEICERCFMRVVHKGVSHCGTPFLQKVNRDPIEDGCGCPCNDKARDPNEHCPLDTTHRPARTTKETCNCKWCG